MPIEFGTGLEVHLEQPGMPSFQLPPPTAPQIAVVGVTGPTGPSGAEPEQWFAGEGPPGVIVGARAGDMYIDELTGDLYRLT